MSYEDNIPEFALRPAKEPEETGDGFDPTPYDRLLYGEEKDTSPSAEEYESPDSKAAVAAEPLEETQTEEYSPQEHEEENYSQQKPEEVKTEAEEETGYSIEPEEEKEEAEPKKKKESVKIIPLSQNSSFSKMKITDVRDKMPERVYIEEDILVPDVKPDLLSVLAMDAAVKISEKEIQTGQSGEETLSADGEVVLQTVYLPEKASEQEPLITIRSSVPFKADWTVNAEPYSKMSIQPQVERVDYTVINERKFRAKVTITLNMKEYKDMELDIFEGIKGEAVQILKEDITVTDIAASKRDIIDINEELPLKETGAVPEKILKYDINIAENHRQITGEKAVINASATCNVLYLAKVESEEQTEAIPRLYQGKCEFTQFIPLEAAEGCSGSRVSFEEKDLKIRIADENEAQAGFVMEGSVITSLDVYKNVTKGMVADIYHKEKEITYDMAKVRSRVLKGSGMTDITVRETALSPEAEINEVIYISGKIKNISAKAEKGRAAIEGTLAVKLLCMPEEKSDKPFSISKDIPFKDSIDIVNSQEEMEINAAGTVRELWFDVINGKQVEIRGSICASAEVMETKELKLMKNLCLLESEEPDRKGPSMVLYITRKGDCMWDIAKKYRTTVERLKAINEVEADSLEEGKKLLVVR